jgi:hypothetical protein
MVVEHQGVPGELYSENTKWLKASFTRVGADGDKDTMIFV